MRNSSQSHQEAYIQRLFQIHEKSLSRAKAESDLLNLSGISISSAEALTLQFFLQTWKSQKHIEIGTLTGYSAVAAALALGPGAKLWTFEKNLEHVRAAEKVFSELSLAADSGHAEIHLCIGDAEQELVKIEPLGPFDSIFIDGNKAAYGSYLAWAEKFIRRGGLIMADNVFLSGRVYEDQVDSKFSKKQVEVLQKFNERLADRKLYRSCLIPTGEGLFVAEKLF
jgi:caffeoyl-CoA O-methyltransferase